MAEVPFRPARQLREYKGKGASASREYIRAFDIEVVHVIFNSEKHVYKSLNF